MLNVERLKLRLPSGFAPRAAFIARLVGEELGQSSWTTGGDLARLRLPPLQVSPNASDREIAHAVAGAIVRGIQGGLE